MNAEEKIEITLKLLPSRCREQAYRDDIVAKVLLAMDSLIPRTDTAFMRDMPRIYPWYDYDESETPDPEWLCDSDSFLETSDWYCELFKLEPPDSEDVESRQDFYAEMAEKFYQIVEDALASGDVLEVESVQGLCRVGANRVPSIRVVKEPNLLDGQKEPDRNSTYTYKYYVGNAKKRINAEQWKAIRAIPEKTPRADAIEYVKAIFPKATANWQSILDEDSLFWKRGGSETGENYSRARKKD